MEKGIGDVQGVYQGEVIFADELMTLGLPVQSELKEAHRT
jgi:hypothetical protein